MLSKFTYRSKGDESSQLTAAEICPMAAVYRIETGFFQNNVLPPEGNGRQAVSVMKIRSPIQRILQLYYCSAIRSSKTVSSEPILIPPPIIH